MANFFDNKARAQAAKAEASGSSSKTTLVNGAEQQQLNKPWVERYRPRTLEDVKAQDHVTTVLRRMVHASNLPHLLLYGGPGTGKTSTILALCRELYGPELFSSRVLELNASDERGISVIRERVRNYAAQALVNPPGSSEYRKRYPCPSFKVIILDEADSLSQDAQAALRRVIEIYSKTCRFCLICNYVTRIIDPIASRTAKFRFKPLESTQSKERIAGILKQEGVSYEPGVIERTLDISEGDLRRALQLLQSASKLVSAAAANQSGASGRRKPPKVIEDEDDEEMTDVSTDGPAGTVTTAIIDEVAGVVPTAVIENLISVMKKSKFNAIQNEVTEIVASGYSANEVLLSLFKRLMFDDMIPNQKKNKMAVLFSERDKKLADGSDEHLLLLDLVCGLAPLLAR